MNSAARFTSELQLMNIKPLRLCVFARTLFHRDTLDFAEKLMKIIV